MPVDAAFGLDIDHQKVAGVAEGMALEPRRLRPRHAQHSGADGCDGHVVHGRISSYPDLMLRKPSRRVNGLNREAHLVPHIGTGSTARYCMFVAPFATSQEHPCRRRK